MGGKRISGIGSVLISLIILLASCQKKTENQSRFYNIDSLVEAQVKLLSAVPSTLTREIRLGDKVVTKVLSYRDTAAWMEELDEFKQLRVINKPTYAGAFRIEGELNDPGSNLKIKALTNTRDLPIKYFKIYYQERPYRTRKIEALYNEENSLYESSRILTMEFRDVYNKTVLVSYSIEGGQKMFLGDSIDFSIRGKIQID